MWGFLVTVGQLAAAFVQVVTQGPRGGNENEVGAVPCQNAIQNAVLRPEVTCACLLAGTQHHQWN